MPVKDKPSLKQRLTTIILDTQKEKPELRSRLNEKGVECSILIPIAEIIWEFDALKDIEYELGSKSRNDQRFDFLIEGNFLIEAKKLGTNLAEMEKQIDSYIMHNDNIYYGILSNGYDFSVYIQKSFIKGFLNPTEELLVPIKKDVIRVFTVKIDEEEFEKIIGLFSKDTYKYHFERIAKYALSCFSQGKGINNITGESKINEIIKGKIRNTLNVKKGKYLDDLKANKIKVGDKLAYETDDIKIVVAIEHDGRVKLSKGDAIIKNMNSVMKNRFKPMINLVMGDWSIKDEIESDPIEFIRKAQGGIKKLYHRENYEFKRVNA